MRTESVEALFTLRTHPDLLFDWRISTRYLLLVMSVPEYNSYRRRERSVTIYASFCVNPLCAQSRSPMNRLIVLGGRRRVRPNCMSNSLTGQCNMWRILTCILIWVVIFVWVGHGLVKCLTSFNYIVQVPMEADTIVSAYIFPQLENELQFRIIFDSSLFTINTCCERLQIRRSDDHFGWCLLYVRRE